nr:hypothetical protein [uncultured Lacibacter sp.]
MNFNGILPELFRKPFLLACTLLLLLNSCKRTETLETLTIDELVPLTVGKYITYRLDSLVFTNAGKAEEIHRYQVKHVVDRESTDNLGRPAWVIATYLNDSVASGQWVQNGTYTITKVDKRLEVNEHNLRMIKLNLPVREGFVWRGNTHLPDHPYSPEFPLGIDESMDLWEYRYENINASETIGTTQLTDVTTVFHIDESENVPMKTDTSFASRELSVEKYAKNIGLVFREFQLWENQPRKTTSGQTSSYDPVRIGFGVKMWMIAKN